MGALPLFTRPPAIATSTVTRTFATSIMSKSSQAFIEAVKTRRSVYQLSKDSPIPDSKIEEIVKDAILHTPTSFNYQIGRAIILFGDEHEKLWDITADVLKGMLPADQFESGTKPRLDGFKAAKGTVLLFDDKPTVRKQEEDFPTYAANFQPWASQSHGILAYIIWTALEQEGLGANLQHYSNLIERKVQEVFDVPVEWQLGSQLVFGAPVAPAGEKSFKPIEERFRSLGGK